MEDGGCRTYITLGIEKEKEDLKEMQSNQKNVWETEK